MSELTLHWRFPRHKAAMQQHKLSSQVAIAITTGERVIVNSTQFAKKLSGRVISLKWRTARTVHYKALS
jgi:hypothetical protein